MIRNKDIEPILSDNLVFYNKLDDSDKKMMIDSALVKKYNKGQILIEGGSECIGLIIVVTGQLRIYTVSDEGKEITFFRLLEGDSCILSAASCMLKDISFDINISFEKNSETIIIPTSVYEKINARDINVKSFTLDLVSSRFSDVIWVLEKYVFKGLAPRLAEDLIDKSLLQDSLTLKITHEEIAKDLGTAREVVTRLLKRFAQDGIVNLNRGSIEIIDVEALKNI